ncbi:unnamed protein product [Peronospora farinosa]|uniref:RCC1-like domain-containing protein n=1 Tax=Peronospora farinosa TaxID=134698 RepID=A0ABN8CKA7_9STRA|nr:unnamed protein product [Peronospora farinosa]
MECVCVSASDGLFGECVSPTDRTFVAVDGGDTFTIGILADSGEVVGWGRAFYGELPEELVHMKQCKAVACGSNHVLALTDSGHVVAWGWNRSGQVAATATEKQIVRVPMAVEFPIAPQRNVPVQIVEVAAGGMHSMALDTCGRVWAWGCNVYGQSGTGSDMKKVDVLSHVALPSEVHVKHIAAGWAHSALISTTGEVFTFGWGLYNQLGHGSPQNELRPVIVDALRGLDSDVVQVACGNWHTAALTASGDLYTWGWGKDGQLAHEASVSMQVIPRVVSVLSSPAASDDAKDVMAVACGNRYTLAACRDGSVQWWGQKPAGFELHDIVTCPESPQHTEWLPQNGRHVRKLAAGNSHALILLEKEHEQEILKAQSNNAQPRHVVSR